MGFWRHMLFLYWGKEMTRRILGLNKRQQRTIVPTQPAVTLMSQAERAELNRLRDEMQRSQQEYNNLQDELERLQDEYDRLTEMQDEDAEDSDEAVEIYRRIGKLEGLIMNLEFKQDRLDELESKEDDEFF